MINHIDPRAIKVIKDWIDQTDWKEFPKGLDFLEDLISRELKLFERKPPLNLSDVEQDIINSIRNMVVAQREISLDAYRNEILGLCEACMDKDVHLLKDAIKDLDHLSF